MDEVVDMTYTRFFSRVKDAVFTDSWELLSIFARENWSVINFEHLGEILSSLVTPVKRNLNLKAGSLVSRRNPYTFYRRALQPQSRPFSIA